MVISVISRGISVKFGDFGNSRYPYMTLLFILVTLAHFHFVLVVDTVPYSGALSNCRDCDVIE
jgi:hypothetical protein